MKVLDEWDLSYLQEIAGVAADETSRIERKAAAIFDPKTSKTRDEIAKQACAFANSGGGFLIFGIQDSGQLDEGVQTLVGNQTVKDWIEALIPKLTLPTITGCEAKLIFDPCHHGNDRSVLVVFIPASDSRPQWISNKTPEVSYLRVGSHSGPMSLMTFQDLCSRSSSASVQIDPPEDWEISPRDNGVFLNPRVTLQNGVATELWTFVVKMPPGIGMLVSEWATNTTESVNNELHFKAYQPLFPGNSTPVGVGSFGLAIGSSLTGDTCVEMSIYAGSAKSVTKSFNVFSLKELARKKSEESSKLNLCFATRIHAASTVRRVTK